jgi:hypothetical protein
MEKEPKIELQNLFWATGDKTGAVPYIFNTTQTAIKLYSEEYNFDVLPLQGEKGMSNNQKALAACAEYFGENFYSVSSAHVFENSFSFPTQMIKFVCNGSQLDTINFSKKEISYMQKRYNKYMESAAKLKAKLEHEEAERLAEQNAIMDF